MSFLVSFFSISVINLVLVLLFQTSRTCPQLFRKNCLMRCWTEMCRKVKYLLYQLPGLVLQLHMLCLHINAVSFRERNQIHDDCDGLAPW